MSKMLLNGSGHGGKDVGAIACDGSHEKTYNLKLCKAVHERVFPYIGTNAKILKTGDTFIEISDRCKIADKLAPVYWFEWHHNAFNKKARGIEILTSNFTAQKNKDFASYLCQGYSKLMGIPNRGAKVKLNSAGRDHYGVHRLSGKDTTVFIIEPLFIDNPEDFKILTDANYINKTADFFAYNILQGLFGIEMKKDPTKSDYIWQVQTGAFAMESNAKKQAEDLKKLGYKPIIKKVKNT